MQVIAAMSNLSYSILRNYRNVTVRGESVHLSLGCRKKSYLLTFLYHVNSAVIEAPINTNLIMLVAIK